MRITHHTTDSAAMQELGTRIARHRLNRNLTQATLAAEAGVSVPTVQRLEQGKSCQASSLIRILRALKLLEHLDGLVPEPTASPIQQLRMRGKLRRRASSPAGTRIRERPAAWTWAMSHDGGRSENVGTMIGAVSWDDDRGFAAFEYAPTFLPSGREVAPLTMPLAAGIYSFPALAPETFHGLPGLLADSLPDRFGNALIDVWLAGQGRSPDDFNPVERLCYVGERGMGALEFVPATGPDHRQSTIEVATLVELASEILTTRRNLAGSFEAPRRQQALQSILRVGTSAGGARAKAIIAWNSTTDEVRTGQVSAGDGFSYWLLKFDGVAGNRDRELEDPQGYGLIEYAYHLMARAAGITMAHCRILRERGRNHFMTRRFDRTATGDKTHLLSLGAMAHYDFNQAGAHSYEQALRVIERLDLGKETVEEQFRRMAFNIVARNQDDHVKNIAFLMDRSGSWSLAPAFDVTYSYNPGGRWTGAHQMSLNGKREGFVADDFDACARTAAVKRGRGTDILRQVREAVLRWPEFAAQAGVPEATTGRIGSTQRTAILP